MLFGGDNLDDDEEEPHPIVNDEHQYLDDTWVATLEARSEGFRIVPCKESTGDTEESLEAAPSLVRGGVDWRHILSYKEGRQGPTPRYGNSVSHHKGRLVIFGGVGEGESFMEDTHMFSLWGFEG